MSCTMKLVATRCSSNSDTTSTLPLEVKTAVLARLPRADLLQMALVSCEWRDIAKVDSRFFLVARFTSSSKPPLQDLMNDFEKRVDYAVANNFWLKMSFDAQRPYRHKSMVAEATWLEEGRPLVERLCGLLPCAMPRVVSLYLAVSETLWTQVDQTLVFCPASVLRVLELSLPELTSQGTNLQPKEISPHLFSDRAPLLRSLKMSHFAIGPKIVAAFGNVCDLIMSVNTTDQCIHGHGSTALKLALLFPCLKNLGVDVGEADDAGTEGLFDLTGVALRSLDTWLIGEDSPDPAQLLIIPPFMLTDIALSRISHYAESVQTAKFQSHLAGCQSGSAPISLDVVTDCSEGHRPQQLRRLYVSARTIGVLPIRERIFCAERDIYESGPDLDILAATALSTFCDNLVSLTINMDFVSQQHHPKGSPLFSLLQSLDIQVHKDLAAWPNDHLSGVTDRSQEANLDDNNNEATDFVLPSFNAPNLSILRLCAVGSSRCVASQILKNLHRILRRSTKPHPSHPLALELHGVLVSTSLSRLQDALFLEFSGGVSMTDRIVGVDEISERYANPNVYMSEDFKEFGAIHLCPVN